jgi:hypothetical protein
MLAMCSPAAAGTRVWLMYGWGDNFAGSSSGIDEIAARARTIPGVDQVNVRNYWDTTTIYNEAISAPAGTRIILGGYSCGLNSATVVARGMWQSQHKVATVVGIQQSLWCGGDALESNVKYGQSTFNADCWDTGGLGCKPLEPAPSFAGKIVNIDRVQGHGAADNDPDTQADVLKAIAATSLYGRVPPPRPPAVSHPIPPEVSTGPIIPPPPSRPPIAAGIDCRWAWSSNRGWAVLCSRPDSRVRNIVRYRGRPAY